MTNFKTKSRIDTLTFILAVLADVAGITFASEAVEPVDAGAAVQARVAVAFVHLRLTRWTCRRGHKQFMGVIYSRNNISRRAYASLPRASCHSVATVVSYASDLFKLQSETHRQTERKPARQKSRKKDRQKC
jgi:hypothetical protein